MKASWLFRTALILFLSYASGVAQPVGPSQPFTFGASKLEVRQENGQEVSDLIGNVWILQGVVRITADRATIYNRNSAILLGNVHVTQPGIEMTGPRAEYDGNTRIARAPNGVVLIDNGATLRAGSGEFDMNAKISYFRGGVTLNDGKSLLRAGSGDYYSYERRAVFRDNVQVTSDSGTINAREITHWRGTQESFAVGNVLLISRKNNVRITGDTLIHRPTDGYSIATGHPKLVQLDTTRIDSTGEIRRDTTVITARLLESLRKGNEAYIATDSVRLRRGSLEAVAGIARYLPGPQVIALGSGRATAQRVASGDSVVVALPSDTSVSPGPGSPAPPAPPVAHGPDPVVWYGNSQLTGDTITVQLRDRRLQSINIVGNAFALSEGEMPERYDQMAAIRLYFNVADDTIRQVRAEDQASSIYYVYDGKRPRGVNRSSGDTIRIDFEGGHAAFATVEGRRTRAESEYFPEKLTRGRADEFRLQGFRLYDRDGSLKGLNTNVPRPASIPEPPMIP